MFNGKKLLIIGGTGSFGHAVLNRFLHTDIQEVRILSRDENKQDEMRLRLSNPKVKFHLGSIRDFNCVKTAMRDVDYVFQAAALKQVPSCEFFPFEAVRTNINGTENILNAALDQGVQKVIALSTDKAVYPINAMGISKAMMEKLVVAKSRVAGDGQTVFNCTRFGNIMASRGSVIPLFVRQLKEGLPLTLTDPNMTRFLMSMDHAVDLVLHAYLHGEQGDIIVQKTPASTIGDLAQALLELFEGKSGIRIIGKRHGEKLYETLLTGEEMDQAIELEGYYRVPADPRSLNDNHPLTTQDEGRDSVDYNSHTTQRLSVEEIKGQLLGLKFIQTELKGGTGCVL